MLWWNLLETKSRFGLPLNKHTLEGIK